MQVGVRADERAPAIAASTNGSISPFGSTDGRPRACITFTITRRCTKRSGSNGAGAGSGGGGSATVAPAEATSAGGGDTGAASPFMLSTRRDKLTDGAASASGGDTGATRPLVLSVRRDKPTERSSEPPNPCSGTPNLGMTRDA